MVWGHLANFYQKAGCSLQGRELQLDKANQGEIEISYRGGSFYYNEWISNHKHKSKQTEDLNLIQF